MSDRFAECGRAGRPLRDQFVMDSHCHLGTTSIMRQLDTSVESMIHGMDLMGVDVAAASATMACMDGLTIPGNDLIIDAVQRFPERMVGYMAVNPLYPREAKGELRRCLAAGLRAVKVHCFLGPRYTEAGYELVWEFAAEHGLPVLVHTGGRREIDEVEPFFRRFPSIRWIMAHGGFADREEYVRVGTTYPNVYVDTVLSASPRGLLEYFVASGLEDKLLWGSDVTFMAGPSELGRVLFARLSEDQKARILGGNAQRVFGLAEGAGLALGSR